MVDARLFELRIGDPPAGPELTVVSFRGREDLSRTFAWDVRVIFRADGAMDGSLIGLPATFTLDPEGASPRAVEGVVASVRPEAQSVVRGQRAAVVRLVPRFWLLKRRVASRIFQELTVPEIVEKLLGGAEVPLTLQLNRSYAKRDYCVQYQESDHAFLARIAAEEGIFWCFDGTKVVFLDDAAGYLAMAGDPLLRHREGKAEGVVRDDDVAEFALTASVKPTAVLLRDYDFKRPLLDLRAEASVPPIPGLPASPPELEIYDHRGEYDGPEVDEPRATAHLEQWRAAAEVGRGTSACRRLAPGRRFKLEVDAAPTLSREYAVTSVRHEGHVPGLTTHSVAGGSGGGQQVYSNRFECVPATVPARPRRPRRRLQSVLESAVVTGPKGEEIHTDEHGRIKVQFHWDRDGKRDEHSSCWIRVVQTWAGASMGAQFIPRVGMEVMVSFLGGDRDCPIVTGCVHNATHPVPFMLPGNKTRSGWRSESSPGGKGFNELSFQDAKGSEQIYLHAQRDLEEVVGRRHDLEVRGDESITVQGAQTVLVRGVRKDTTEGESSRTVSKDETIKVEGNRLDVVTGNLDQRVTGGATVRVVGRDRREIEGRGDLTVGEDYTLRVKGCLTTVVGQNDAKRSWVVRAEGIAHVSSSEAVEIDAEKGVTLRCGKSFIKISDDKIELVSPAVMARGEGGGLSVADDKVKLSAKKDLIITTETLLIKTPDSSLSMRKDVQIDGEKILLNSPDKATAPVTDPSPPPTGIQMKDQSGKPLAYKRFLITLDDGSEYSGILDKEGKIEMELPGSGKITFPDLAKPGGKPGGS